MCGIAAIFSYRRGAAPVDAAELTRIADRMNLRGPDGQGQWLGDQRRVGLAHRRLSIIDLSADAGQPMVIENGRFRIVFNGEIYNYRELRADLEAAGHRFRSHSDTEVLLRLYADRGADMVTALRGMFAFVIWDNVRAGMLLVRDHFGIKPLYAHDDGESFRVASQVKALLAGGGLAAVVEPAAEVGFYLWGNVPEPFTWYRNVFAVPPGHSIWVDAQGVRTPQRYFDLADELESAQQQSLQGRTAAEALQESLRDSVVAHRVADVPVGVFLSAGLDSAVIAALATQADDNVEALTLRFAEYADSEQDEAPLAALVADHYGCRHRTSTISREDFATQRGAILDAMDQPSIDGVNTWLVAREAAAAGWKVALSGLGGDELLGGYPSFSQLPQMVDLCRWPARLPGFGRGFRWLSAPLLRRMTSPKYAGLFEYGGGMGGAYLLRRGLFMPWELPALLDTEVISQGWQSLQPVMQLERAVAGLERPHAQVATLEMAFYMRNQLLRDADWAGMAHSLEIRVPLVDINVFRALAPHLVGERPPRKGDMASVPLRALPKPLLQRSKTGFSVPVAEWLAADAPADVSDDIPLRGLRDWSRRVARSQRGQRGQAGARIYGVFSDAFGASGGIARFNQNLIQAVCCLPAVERFDVLLRTMPQRHPAVPFKVSLWAEPDGSLAGFGRQWWRSMGAVTPTLVICGHINLLPLAAAAARRHSVPLCCVLHGVDAWRPHRRAVVRRLLPSVEQFFIVSETTRDRFLDWADVDPRRCNILHNTYDPQQWCPGAASPELQERYGLVGKQVILTVSRLAQSERYKGHDEIIELMPELLAELPDLMYLIVGDGDDRPRLERKVRRRGLQRQVVLAGHVDEAEKADHYRLADVFAMPGRGEGFGIVYLEAMACGIPVIGSILDGSRDALRGGELGRLVSPDQPDELLAALLAALRQGTGTVPEGLSQFNLAAFSLRLEQLLVQSGLLADRR